MNRNKLNRLFNPKSVAIIGASNKIGSIGYWLVKNCIGGGYGGKIFPVNPKYPEIFGLKCYDAISSIPAQVDLALVATPALSVPEIIDQCGRAGAGSAVVISAGFKESGSTGVSLASELKKSAQKYALPVLGPNCLGFIRPKINLNASFSRRSAKWGPVAFISQSGALCSSMLDLSETENIGYSYFVSIGEMIDIGFHDLIDYFQTDEEVNSIVIYMESLEKAREFMSAARNFTKNKPLIVLKVGKSEQAAYAAKSHTGSLTGNDTVFNAAFLRSGIIRVNTMAELFDCVKILNQRKRPDGNRLAIVTNAGGPGVIATDCLISRGGRLAVISDNSLNKLNATLPSNWSHGNPLDILGDSDPQRYKSAVEACITDPGVDGILVILTAQAGTDPVGVAKIIVESAKKTGKTILASFMGDTDVSNAIIYLKKGGIPTFANSDEAVNAFMDIANYSDIQKQIYEQPQPLPYFFKPNFDETKKLISGAISNRKYVLPEPVAKRILADYDIPVPKGAVVKSPWEAGLVAGSIGFPLVAKIISPQIVHKFDVGGVVVGINSKEEAQAAYDKIVGSVRKNSGQVTIEGVYLEQMVRKKHELLLGSYKDSIFGPVIVFGTGGTYVEIYKDTNVALPPLNMAYARQLMDGSKISTILSGYRNTAQINKSAIQFILYKLSCLVSDFPQIKELDINPLAVDSSGEIVLDAKIILDEKINEDVFEPYSHLAILPPPAGLSESVAVDGVGTVEIRPIKAEDEAMYGRYLRSLSPQSVRHRFFVPEIRINLQILSGFTNIDYAREIALVALINDNSQKVIIGEARYKTVWGLNQAEFMLAVSDQWQNKGLGSILLDKIIQIAFKAKIGKLFLIMQPDNYRLIHMLEKRNFRIIVVEDALRAEIEMNT